MVPSDVDGLTPCRVELAPDNPDKPASPCTDRQCGVDQGGPCPAASLKLYVGPLQSTLVFHEEVNSLIMC